MALDLLVTDVGLAGGPKLRPGLRLLVIAGHAENVMVEHGQLGPDMAVLAKPFAMDNLAGKMRRLIERLR